MFYFDLICELRSEVRRCSNLSELKFERMHALHLDLCCGLRSEVHRCSILSELKFVRMRASHHDLCCELRSEVRRCFILGQLKFEPMNRVGVSVGYQSHFAIMPPPPVAIEEHAALLRSRLLSSGASIEDRASACVHVHGQRLEVDLACLWSRNAHVWALLGTG